MKNSMPTLITLKDRFVQMKEERFALKKFREHKLIASEMAHLLSCVLLIKPGTHDQASNDADTHVSYTTIKLAVIKLPERHISGSLS